MQSVDDLATQLTAAERRLEQLTREVARNEAKMRRSQERELRLLNAPDLVSLIRELTDGLAASYGLETVTLVLADPDHDIRHLLLANGTPAEDIEHLITVESMTGLAPQFTALQKPWLGGYVACDHQLVFPAGSVIGSIAMIPLRRSDHLIGSINLGSRDRERFTRAHASDFLAHLGVIASFCIENVLNRARLTRSGFTDVLTGWHNRRYLQIRLREELARAARDDSRLVCLMLDVDHFKRINDTWGHAAGDAVLREVASRVESEVRASDVAARYGGEEFVVLLPNTDLESGQRLAERIRCAVAGTRFSVPGADQEAITVSIGIAAVEPGSEHGDLKTLGESLLARADVALYRAKADGRDRIAVDRAA